LVSWHNLRMPFIIPCAKCTCSMYFCSLACVFNGQVLSQSDWNCVNLWMINFKARVFENYCGWDSEPHLILHLSRTNCVRWSCPSALHDSTWGNAGADALILNLIGGERMVSCPQSLYPQGKSPVVSPDALANLISFAFIENVSSVCVCCVNKFKWVDWLLVLDFTAKLGYWVL
jgi:hypothetical protein